MARSLNKAMIIGNIGSEPQSRYTANGTCVVNFSVATNRRRQDPNGEWQDEVEWHRIVAWERNAEFVQQYCGKGIKVYVEGRLQTRKWTDNQGVQRYSTEIVAYEILKLSYDDTEESEMPTERERVGAASAKRPAAKRKKDDWGDTDMEDVPFD